MAESDPHAASQLLPLLYDGLRSAAAAQLGQEKPGQTLQPTALVHEAYCGSSARATSRTGIAGAISSPPRPRRCAASW